MESSPHSRKQWEGTAGRLLPESAGQNPRPASARRLAGAFSASKTALPSARLCRTSIPSHFLLPLQGGTGSSLSVPHLLRRTNQETGRNKTTFFFYYTPLFPIFKWPRFSAHSSKSRRFKNSSPSGNIFSSSKQNSGEWSSAVSPAPSRKNRPGTLC